MLLTALMIFFLLMVLAIGCAIPLISLLYLDKQKPFSDDPDQQEKLFLIYCHVHTMMHWPR